MWDERLEVIVGYIIWGFVDWVKDFILRIIISYWRVVSRGVSWLLCDEWDSGVR